MDTTIEVAPAVRARLAVLARERGTTVGDLVQQLAEGTPTQAELRQRQHQAAEYVRTHLISDFNEADLTAGRQVWEDLHSTESGVRTAGRGGRSDAPRP